MPVIKRHRKTEKKRFTILFVPSSKSDYTKSFEIGKIGITLLLSSLAGIIFLAVIALFIYTPLNTLLPISNPELENRYGKQIVDVQIKLKNLLNEIVSLRQYNLQLRKALGEKISEKDSLLLTQIPKTPVSAPDETLHEQLTEHENIDIKPVFEIDHSEFPHGRAILDLDIGMPDFPIILPVQGFISRSFIPDEGHFGIDIIGKEGIPIMAAASGTVVFSDWSYDYGFMMIIAHGNGFLTVYKHNKQLLKSVGEPVKRNEPIALLGNTGKKSTGPHLHFELWKNGIALDPKDYLLTTK